jgi:hypothetical protein
MDRPIQLFLIQVKVHSYRLLQKFIQEITNFLLNKRKKQRKTKIGMNHKKNY